MLEEPRYEYWMVYLKHFSVFVNFSQRKIITRAQHYGLCISRKKKKMINYIPISASCRYQNVLHIKQVSQKKNKIMIVRWVKKHSIDFQTRVCGIMRIYTIVSIQHNILSIFNLWNAVFLSKLIFFFLRMLSGNTIVAPPFSIIYYILYNNWELLQTPQGFFI